MTHLMFGLVTYEVQRVAACFMESHLCTTNYQLPAAVSLVLICGQCKETKRLSSCSLSVQEQIVFLWVSFTCLAVCLDGGCD